MGDWIIGTGSKKLKRLNKLIYAMRVDDKMTFDEYYNSPLFQCKKPVVNGSLMQMYGDNIYHTNDQGDVVQDQCGHSNKNLTPNAKHRDRDARGKFVLLSKHFYYFGDQCPTVPDALVKICCTSRNYSYKDISQEDIDQFVEWLEKTYEPGIHGDPINWCQYKLPKLAVYETK